jgi:hypothetical protein
VIGYPVSRMLFGTGSPRIPLASTLRRCRTLALSPVSAAVLSRFESEALGFFIQTGRAFGLPRSVAEIYGLLFISTRPLATDDFIDRLSLSKGSASQRFKYLRTLLSCVFARFVRSRVLSHCDRGEARPNRLVSSAKRLWKPERTCVRRRISLLPGWEKRSRRFLPLVGKLLSD